MIASQIPHLPDPLRDRNSDGQHAEHKPVFSIPARNAFFVRVSDRLRDQLPDRYCRFTARPMFNLMKIAYGNDRIHYEIAIDNGNRLLEIALHFEDGPVSTLAYLATMDRNVLELKHKLGHQVELERWTASWGRIYELWPLEEISPATADKVANRLSDYVRTLQPIVDLAGIPPERSAQAAGPRRERWRQKTPIL